MKCVTKSDFGILGVQEVMMSPHYFLLESRHIQSYQDFSVTFFKSCATVILIYTLVSQFLPSKKHMLRLNEQKIFQGKQLWRIKGETRSRQGEPFTALRKESGKKEWTGGVIDCSIVWRTSLPGQWGVLSRRCPWEESHRQEWLSSYPCHAQSLADNSPRGSLDPKVERWRHSIHCALCCRFF